ncbi:MAG: HAMP domain-containing protein, partial [Candidatus Atribacteria bacterium]|nr:HAMP domain-containing protein [Candidatus Atribacteria bacterium]
IYNISEAAKRISAQSLNQHLNYQGSQDEVKDLADAFDSMLGRLEANFEQQSQFVSNLAHELRTPLTIMRMNVEILHSDPQASFEDYQELTITLEKSLTRLERLAQDLLLLTKGEKGIAYQTIFLGVLIEEILEELTPIAHENEINLKMSGEIDCEIRVDSILLQRALSNLVENGILYNHPGGFVEILCYKEVNQVVIEVCDNGIGIGENDQTHIFERFYRAKGVYTNNQNGKGLGLAITAHIIRLHQGCIEVESQLGVGTTFRVFLPL